MTSSDPLPARLVVFDVDGTLVDSQHLILAGIAEAFTTFGLPVPAREAALGIVGLSLPEAMLRLAPELGRDEVMRLVEGYRSGFTTRRIAGSAPLYPGAMRAVEALAARSDLRMGIATGKSRRGLDHMLAEHDLGRFFQSTQTADDHPSKPHPSMLERVLEETGTDPDRAVMIGDTEFDIEMGRAAGFRTVGVTWGYHPPERLRAAGADLLIDDYAGLLPALDTLWEAA